MTIFKMFIALTSIFIGVGASAQSPVAEAEILKTLQLFQANGHVGTKDCGTCVYNNSTNKLNDCQQTLTTTESNYCKMTLWAQQAFKKRQYQGCGGFSIDDSGNFGNMGKIVLDKLLSDVQKNGVDSPFVKDNKNIDRYCPNFETFDPISRISFYIYLMENLGYREHSCIDSTQVIRGTTTGATCVFQLEADPKVRKKLGRPESCQGPLSYIQSDKGCGECAVDILAWLLGEAGLESTPAQLPESPFGSIANDKVTHHSYWQTLNPETKKTLQGFQAKHPGHLSPHQGLLEDLKWFPLCR